MKTAYPESWTLSGEGEFRNEKCHTIENSSLRTVLWSGAFLFYANPVCAQRFAIFIPDAFSLLQFSDSGKIRFFCSKKMASKYPDPLCSQSRSGVSGSCIPCVSSFETRELRKAIWIRNRRVSEKIRKLCGKAVLLHLQQFGCVIFRLIYSSGCPVANAI